MRLDTLFDYLGDAPLMLDPLVRGRGRRARSTQIADYYERAQGRRMTSIPPHSNYKPLEPRELYLTADEWRERLDGARGCAIHALRGA